MIAEARRICQQNAETVLRLRLPSNIPNSMTKKTVFEWLTTYDQGCEQEAGVVVKFFLSCRLGPPFPVSIT